MGKLSLSIALVGIAACGSDNKNTPDAHIVVPDAAPDAAKVFMDAPPPTYDFSCYQQAAPTTAADPVTVAGTTDTVSQAGLAAIGGVTVDFFKTGTATSLGTVVSDAVAGTFTSGNLATGAAPLDAYVRASLATYRTTYLYPPNKVVANLAGVPVPMLSNSTFTALQALTMVTQDDNLNGALFVAITDCALMPINGATLSVKQGSTEVGTQYDLGALVAQAAGTFVVLNVPDGATDISATYNNMTFPAHTVMAHKKIANTGSLTASAVRPGP
jgi:hypothetical protein